MSFLSDDSKGQFISIIPFYLREGKNKKQPISLKLTLTPNNLSDID